MPRAGDYHPWSSKKCYLLNQFEKQRDVVFREEERKPTRKELKEGRFQRGDMVTVDKDDIEGRAHQEEAFLIYERGILKQQGEECTKCAALDGKFDGCVVMPSFHNGSCANCVFQSNTNGCTLASAAIIAKSTALNEVKRAKALQKEAAGKTSSKRKRQVTISNDDESGEENAEDGLAAATNERERRAAERVLARGGRRRPAKAARRGK